MPIVGGLTTLGHEVTVLSGGSTSIHHRLGCTWLGKARFLSLFLLIKLGVHWFPGLPFPVVTTISIPESDATFDF